MNQRPVITLLTDFGERDGFIGVMKGVMMQIAPQAVFIDISHSLTAYSISSASFLNHWSFGYFQAGTVHLCVIDPGVGTERRPIAVESQGHFFVAPDNGVLSPIFRDDPNAKIIALTNSRYWLDFVSDTFHGRDLFSPVAAHLAAGVPIEELGEAISDPVLLPTDPPSLSKDGILCHVRYVDRFGNLVTDLDQNTFYEWAEIQGYSSQDVIISFADTAIQGISRAYGEKEPGDLVAVFNGYNCLEIAVTTGNASQRTGLGLNATVRVRPATE